MENFIYLKMKLKSKSLSRVIGMDHFKTFSMLCRLGGIKQISFGAHLFGILTFMVALVQTGLPLKKLRQVFTDSGVYSYQTCYVLIVIYNYRFVETTIL